MSHKNRSLLAILVLLLSALVTVGGGVATAPAAHADYYPTCSHHGCAEAYDSTDTWESLGFPSSRGWYDWPPTGTCNFAGGTYRNYEGELPAGHSYLEFDVTPRACGAPRQAWRIVLDRTTDDVYFTPDHYRTFYLM